MGIAFIDLQAQRLRLEPAITEAIGRVLERGDFIQGREVGEFEAALAAFTGARHVLSCANGTDALTLVGMAEGVGVGDAVFVPSFTFVATAEAFSLLGATPYFVDVLPDTFDMDAASLKAAIVDARVRGLRPKMVVAVDLFGQPADYAALTPIARDAGAVMVADAAQGLGGEMNGKRVGTLADYTTTSFFPAKPLGCYGDGGAVLCDDADKAALIKSLAQHGKGTEKYDNVRIGLNSRLDTLQAAVLIEKLRIFGDEIDARNRVAARYTEALHDVATVPVVREGALSSWAQYTLTLKNRDDVQARLKAAGVPSAVYYPLPLNRQGGYRDCPVAPAGVAVSERLAGEVLSLPMHPYLDAATQDKIIEAVQAL
ncbi:MAG: DegT/DnrJ/EryC1/StrS family aminotransferase [Alphaproteobacteria bacterium]|nr:DegT/DnrJ/EryC1/StrS family aminotransferase [Alphaproteobacteria bacterium]